MLHVCKHWWQLNLKYMKICLRLKQWHKIQLNIFLIVTMIENEQEIHQLCTLLYLWQVLSKLYVAIISEIIKPEPNIQHWKRHSRQSNALSPGSYCLPSLKVPIPHVNYNHSILGCIRHLQRCVINISKGFQLPNVNPVCQNFIII